MSLRRIGFLLLLAAAVLGGVIAFVVYSERKSIGDAQETFHQIVESARSKGEGDAPSCARARIALEGARKGWKDAAELWVALENLEATFVGLKRHAQLLANESAVFDRANLDDMAALVTKRDEIVVSMQKMVEGAPYATGGPVDEALKLRDHLLRNANAQWRPMLEKYRESQRSFQHELDNELRNGLFGRAVTRVRASHGAATSDAFTWMVETLTSSDQDGLAISNQIRQSLLHQTLNPQPILNWLPAAIAGRDAVTATLDRIHPLIDSKDIAAAKSLAMSDTRFPWLLPMVLAIEQDQFSTACRQLNECGLRNGATMHMMECIARLESASATSANGFIAELRAFLKNNAPPPTQPSDSAPKIIGTSILWDLSDPDKSPATGILNSVAQDLRKGKRFTILCVDKRDETKVGSYITALKSESGELTPMPGPGPGIPAFQEHATVAVVYWPDRVIAGRYVFSGPPPPKEHAKYKHPSDGSWIRPAVDKWTNSLPWSPAR